MLGKQADLHTSFTMNMIVNVEPESKKTRENSYSITLCICTMNRPDDLNRCLESVFQNNEIPDEIIVSDDSPDGRANQEVIAKYLGVIYQEGPHRGLGANRNACITSAQCGYLIFIDDDVRVPPDFFAIAKRLIASSDSKTIITGYEINYGGGGRWEGHVHKVMPQNPDFWGFQQVPISKNFGAIVINSTIFPQCLFQEAFFDEHLRYGSEEIDMAQHAISLGYRIVYEDCFYVEHYPSPINRDHYHQFIDASRLYATAKAYWQYERSPLKTLAYILLAPLQLAGSAVRRGNISALLSAFQSTVLAGSYLLSSIRMVTLVQK